LINTPLEPALLFHLIDLMELSVGLRQVETTHMVVRILAAFQANIKRSYDPYLPGRLENLLHDG
jgi:hypothetical protein